MAAAARKDVRFSLTLGEFAQTQSSIKARFFRDNDLASEVRKSANVSSESPAFQVAFKVKNYADAFSLGEMSGCLKQALAQIQGELPITSYNLSTKRIDGAFGTEQNFVIGIGTSAPPEEIQMIAGIVSSLDLGETSLTIELSDSPKVSQYTAPSTPVENLTEYIQSLDFLKARVSLEVSGSSSAVNNAVSQFVEEDGDPEILAIASLVRMMKNVNIELGAEDASVLLTGLPGELLNEIPRIHNFASLKDVLINPVASANLNDGDFPQELIAVAKTIYDGFHTNISGISSATFALGENVLEVKFEGMDFFEDFLLSWADLESLGEKNPDPPAPFYSTLSE
eukprot:TRINITY_DN4745_c2_g1_i1.p1 TRINITY_DN4745_c2_g1~~TRINITY_DN4745_c2_g1_i1.p1  ORF type:complete len:340 (-),score=107.78 TRINITY_DN4745_c2_g1_i1:43-1062(-)